MSHSQHKQATFQYQDLGPASSNSRAEILAGLREERKRISPKYFYDDTGSTLFEEITRQPEYYPTRTERHILTEHAMDMAAAIGTGTVLMEPGAGSCEKVRLLLDALKPTAYVPMDIAGDFLQRSAAGLQRQFPWLHIAALRADFAAMPSLPQGLPAGPRTLFYPGSTLGNFSPLQATSFLRHAKRLVGDGGTLLIGVDLHKDSATLNRAYNDSAGVTARFNRNTLHHLNRILPADFEPLQFSHVAFYNSDCHRIEMYLESQTEQTVTAAGEAIYFSTGERIHTEISCKYSQESFTALAAAADLKVRNCWRDAEDLFAVFLLTSGET
ncbi:L-histidine N(alpha)-methyltransferase [Alcanivorax sp. 1008]|uniref:L-histidine N(alpha)-methyltransferase n=1 Tax=Alcanivorax sp. 1008 TaxID=2816853 RepID=UPI001E0162A1|nr:L-histidine N(alpha)-methyltransferase [Alcanivorax sp. 1008]MCC1497867.1 L-histidine N(alpha)-methyltransferase [Alcanivorax sp. 1008]